MKKNIIASFLFLNLLFSTAGCRAVKSVNTVLVPDEKGTNVENMYDSKPNSNKAAAKHYSPYTGEEASPESINKIPFMAVVENSKDARPQSGLSEADIVYETMAEGGIPRFIALFQKNSPEEIGPIRSVRPYFINISKEYNLPFGHCGGSEEALLSIKNENLMSLNEMNNTSSYWRDKERKAPHNLYTSTDKLRSLIKSKGFIKTASSTLRFDEAFWKNSSLPSANTINIKPNKYYTTDYDFKSGNYYKSMDKTPSSDKNNNAAISVSNIVIQITAIKLQQDGSHIDIDLVGSGDGYIISNGKYLKMKWKKDSITAPTRLTDEKGNDIPLSPGKTWWHIVDTNCIIDFK